jgi:hypothetical protein
MLYKNHTLISCLALLTACGSIQEHPPTQTKSREEITTRPGLILQREIFSEQEYDQARQEEQKRKAIDHETTTSIEKYNQWSMALPFFLPILADSDTSQEMAHPQRYKFSVQLDSGQILQIIDLYPFEVRECIRVGTGVVTGKMTLLTGYTGECNNIN